MANELKRMNIRIRPGLHQLLKDSAKERGLSMNAMCVLALETYLTQQQVIENLGPLMNAYDDMKNENN